MRARLGKQFTFHAAHQLPNHDGACRNLHGHTYEVEVLLEGHVSTEEGASAEGMVVDFSVVKGIYKEHIEPLVEHQNLNDTLPVPVTTAENIAGWMYGVFYTHMREVRSVRVWETRTSWAEVRNGDALFP